LEIPKLEKSDKSDLVYLDHSAEILQLRAVAKSCQRGKGAGGTKMREGINNDEILYDSVSLRKIIDEERLCLLVSLLLIINVLVQVQRSNLKKKSFFFILSRFL
jgi:hypothetical protein